VKLVGDLLGTINLAKLLINFTLVRCCFLVKLMPGTDDSFESTSLPPPAPGQSLQNPGRSPQPPRYSLESCTVH
jgi:hypothetical protein